MNNMQMEDLQYLQCGPHSKQKVHNQIAFDCYIRNEKADAEIQEKLEKQLSSILEEEYGENNQIEAVIFNFRCTNENFTQFKGDLKKKLATVFKEALAQFMHGKVDERPMLSKYDTK